MSLLFRSFCSSLGSSSSSSSVRRAADIWKNSQSVLIVTGAGISAESGLPTYRGVSGLYKDKDATADDGMTIEQCLSAATYRTRPDLTWKHLVRVEKACRGAAPSRAHFLLAKMEQYMDPVTIFTQNIDGLHTRAGSTDVLCLHGELYTLKCTNDQCQSSFQVQNFALLEKDGIFPPPCPKCGGQVLRPNVVLFDEYLGDHTVARYEERLGEPMAGLMWTMQPRLHKYDVSISIGTSALFPYVNAAALAGKYTMEINPIQTPLSDRVDCYLQGGATEMLEAIFQEMGWQA